MGLWIADSGADDAAIKRGVDAAHRHFERLGIDPRAAWRALDDIDAADHAKAWAAWGDAAVMALRACYGATAAWPDDAELVWVDD